jgi:hypothetical protein
MLIVWGMMNLKREKADGVPAPSKDMMGPPPPPVPEGEAKKDGMLPDMGAPGQPMGDMFMGVTAPTPVSSLLPSTSPTPTITESTMSKMSNMLGGSDIMNDEPMNSPAPAVYGSSWRQCSCGDGTQVMIMK